MKGVRINRIQSHDREPSEAIIKIDQAHGRFCLVLITILDSVKQQLNLWQS